MTTPTEVAAWLHRLEAEPNITATGWRCLVAVAVAELAGTGAIQVSAEQVAKHAGVTVETAAQALRRLVRRGLLRLARDPATGRYGFSAGDPELPMHVSPITDKETDQ